MAKKMLIDSTHPEETRVVVVNGNKVEEFDFDSASRALITGNIYLAKVSRVEPSLQAAFVDYGGNRQGFLAFSEIHPDYYQIPQADREALMQEELERQAEEAEEEELEDEKREEETQSRRKSRSRRRSSRPKQMAERASEDKVQGEVEGSENGEDEGDNAGASEDAPKKSRRSRRPSKNKAAKEAASSEDADVDGQDEDLVASEDDIADLKALDGAPEDDDIEIETTKTEAIAVTQLDDPREAIALDGIVEEVIVEKVVPEEVETETDDVEEDIRPKPSKKRPQRIYNRYKIQEVIKPRQILLVQVIKEERGNKGAALTTYISLPGRYCVLMPNTARGGGISRKISNISDRKRLRSLVKNFNVPKGAGLIVRTAGARKDSEEIERDYAFLTRQWNQIRELTLSSTAPAPVYEESGPIKRAIRDLLTNDTDEILIEGDKGYREAREYMEVLMPEQVDSVKLYQDKMPLFSRYQVENYLSSMFNPVVQLKSGGYLVIGITEALVAIDVNSGRSTKEASIENTALKTNLEAAEEVARQLKLRDLAGLIVIDFIDMEQHRHQQEVENKLKDCLRKDRARIQVGRISSFGLLEMSRQRLRTGLVEAITTPCPHCLGTGIMRSEDSMALSVIRAIEEEIARGRVNEIDAKVSPSIANYLFNEKRDHIFNFLEQYGVLVRITADPSLHDGQYNIEKIKNTARPMPKAEPVSAASVIEQSNSENEEEAGKSKRRRRSRGGRNRKKDKDREQTPELQADAAQSDEAKSKDSEGDAKQEAKSEDQPKKRSRRKKKPEAERAENAQVNAEGASSGEVSGAGEAAEGSETSGAKPKRRSSKKKSDEAQNAAPQEAEKGEEAPAEKPKRKRRTKAEIEADKAEKEAQKAAKAAEKAAKEADGQAEKPKRKRRSKAEVEAEKLAEGSSTEKPAEKPKNEPETANLSIAESEVSAPEKPAKKRTGWWSA